LHWFSKFCKGFSITGLTHSHRTCAW
jgi:hypothetical protein